MGGTGLGIVRNSMIDTLKLKSGPISEELAGEVESRLVTRLGVDNRTGECLYELVSGSLDGSWESSVSVNVLREEWVTYRSTVANPRARVSTVKQACAPYLVIEGSVHKAMLGHNCVGGPLDVVAAASWFVGDVGSRFEGIFPHWSEWRVLRVDWAEVYELAGFDAVAQYVHGLGLARYARRQPRRYGDECVFFAGTTTTTKFYHKGPEFAKHDHAKLARSTNERYAQDMQCKANSLLRVEISVKSKKLRAQHGDNPLVQDVSPDWLRSLYDIEVARVLKEGQSDMEWVRTADEVERRLYQVYESRLAQALWGTWLKLAAQGETAVRSKLTRPTYFRHRKQLADAGCSWDSTDVYVREDSLIPEGFRPVRSDPRRLAGESPLVKEALFGHPVAV